MDLSALKDYVNSLSELPQEKKTFVITYIDNYVNLSRPKIEDRKRASEDFRVQGIVIGAVEAYLTEEKQGKLKTMIADSFSKTVDDVLKPFDGAKNALFFLTNPIVLVILVLLFLGLLFYFKMLKD